MFIKKGENVYKERRKIEIVYIKTRQSQNSMHTPEGIHSNQNLLLLMQKLKTKKPKTQQNKPKETNK